MADNWRKRRFTRWSSSKSSSKTTSSKVTSESKAKKDTNATGNSSKEEYRELKHEVARDRDTGREIWAPDIQSSSGGSIAIPDVAAVVDASKSGRLECAVCGSTLRRVFGTERRWHFALAPGEDARCSHEPESAEHRRLKMALAHHASNVLRVEDGWSVTPEKTLEDGRRPDILAEHANGMRIAFEVQCADMGRPLWQRRHADYAALNIRDVWILGGSRRSKRKDILARMLAETEGQRVAYITDTTLEGDNLGYVAIEELVPKIVKEFYETTKNTANGRYVQTGSRSTAPSTIDSVWSMDLLVDSTRVLEPLDNIVILPEQSGSPWFSREVDKIHRNARARVVTLQRVQGIAKLSKEYASLNKDLFRAGSLPATNANSVLVDKENSIQRLRAADAKAFRQETAYNLLRQSLLDEFGSTANLALSLIEHDDKRFWAFYCAPARWKTIVYDKLMRGKAGKQVNVSLAEELAVAAVPSAKTAYATSAAVREFLNDLVRAGLLDASADKLVYTVL